VMDAGQVGSVTSGSGKFPPKSTNFQFICSLCQKNLSGQGQKFLGQRWVGPNKYAWVRSSQGLYLLNYLHDFFRWRYNSFILGNDLARKRSSGCHAHKLGRRNRVQLHQVCKVLARNCWWHQKIQWFESAGNCISFKKDPSPKLTFLSLKL